jgi:hypothetical protein
MATKYQPAAARRVLKKEVKELASQLDNPLLKWENPALWQQSNKELEAKKKYLDRITAPEPKDGDERAHIEARQRQLEFALQKGSSSHNIPRMNNRREMSDNPDESTDRELRWQSTWKNWNINDQGNLVKAADGYGAIFEWKDNQYRLNSGEADIFARNAGNLARLRDDTRIPLMGNHAPVSFASPLANASPETLASLDPEGLVRAVEEGEASAPSVEKIYKTEEKPKDLYTRCQAKKKDGRQCSGRPVRSETPWCQVQGHKEQLGG